MIRIYLGLAALFMATAAHADELRPGYMEFTEQAPGNWSLIWKSPMKGGLTPQTQPKLPANCTAKGEPDRAVIKATLVSRYTILCKGEVAGQTIGLTGLETSQTDVLVRVQPIGRPLQAMRLTAATPQAEIVARPSGWQVAYTYFVTGIEHILFGYDHLLFVVALVLLLRDFRTIVKAVTAFTLAHSITLIGTTLGFLGLPQRPVEAVIALSIMFLAVEILKRDPENPRLSEQIPWVVAFGFGLLHGFGFAGALKEIGLPESDVPTALLTFNLGVEVGQLIIVAATMAAMALIKSLGSETGKDRVVRWSAYGIGSIASFWFIERML